MRAPAGRDLADDAFDLAAAGRVEAGGWLVEDQQFGFQRPGAGQRHALLLTAGEQSRRPGASPGVPVRPGPGIRRARWPSLSRCGMSP
jgi:hypothetical protein